MAKKVFLGVGHGGKDSGAVGVGNLLEKDLNLSIALSVNSELLRHGVNVLMSRKADDNETLDDRVAECNAFNPDLAIDIHNNAGGGDGAEAFYHYKGGTSKTLAENVVNEIAKIGQNLRYGSSGEKDGLKYKIGADGRDYYGFIRCTVAPACIVETAFVDNATDIQIVDTEAERKTMGIAIAKGILKTLGIAYVATVDNSAAEKAKYEAEIKTLKEQKKALEGKIAQIKAIVQ